MGVSCGELSLMLFVFNGGFYQTTPGPVQYPLDYKCGLGLVGYTGTALTTQLVVNSGTAPKNGSQNLRYRCPTCDGPLKENGYHQRRRTW